MFWQLDENANQIAAFYLSYKMRRQLFQALGASNARARNISRAPLSVQDHIWPFILEGGSRRGDVGDYLVVSARPPLPGLAWLIQPTYPMMALAGAWLLPGGRGGSASLWRAGGKSASGSALNEFFFPRG